MRYAPGRRKSLPDSSAKRAQREVHCCLRGDGDGDKERADGPYGRGSRPGSTSRHPGPHRRSGARAPQRGVLAPREDSGRRSELATDDQLGASKGASREIRVHPATTTNSVYMGKDRLWAVGTITRGIGWPTVDRAEGGFSS